MFGGGKYVVFDEEHIVIFDPAQAHAEVARYIRGEPTSAGFIQVGIGVRESDYETTAMVSCYGKSESLGGLESNPSLDEALAKQALGMSQW